MAEAPPRRLVDELIARWTLAGVKAVVVEGPNDQRLLQLIMREPHCSPRLREMDVCSVDTIDVPLELVKKNGLDTTGAKQRVVALVREVSAKGAVDGFRGIVDRDLDKILQIDFASPCILYTDHGCMSAYVWTVDVLDRLIVHFRCESAIKTSKDVQAMFRSISDAVLDLVAVRVVSIRRPELLLEMHRSEKALATASSRLSLDLDMYVEQCKPKKGSLDAAKTAVGVARTEIGKPGPLAFLNSHDLLWLLTYVLKQHTSLKPRQIEEDLVESALVSVGVANTGITKAPLFQTLGKWMRA